MLDTLYRSKIPPSVVLFLRFVALYWGVNIIFWVVIYGVTPKDGLATSEVLWSLYIASKFALRVSALAWLPLMILTVLPKFNCFESLFLGYLAKAYMLLAFGLTTLFYVFDVGHYLYLGDRLNASALRFLENPVIAQGFVWESYPVVWISLGLAFGLWGFWKICNICIKSQRLMPTKKCLKVFWSFLVLVVLVVSIWGKFSQYPLRRSDAHFSPNKATVALSLNPILYFFSALKYKDTLYTKTSDFQSHYNTVAKDLGITDPNGIDFERWQSPAFVHQTPPNVIVIMLESMGSNRLGIMGNRLNPTPNLDALIQESVLFERFFVPARSTAKSIFTSLFGIPDISVVRTATRNMFLAPQHTPLGAFVAYNKLYAMGGSLNWANARSVIQRYIPDIKLFEGEHHSKHPLIDTWGTSDLHLFQDAHQELEALSKAGKPFFAYLQTAGNHRPFTVPKGSGFVPRVHEQSALQANGFKDQDYFNGVALLDFSLGEFLKVFHQSSYASNTILVLFGDHGNASTKGHLSASFFGINLHENHVPLVIHAPHVLEAKRIKKIAGLESLMPTIASLAGIGFSNKTLGIDLFDPTAHAQAFIAPRGMIRDGVYVGDKVPKGAYALDSSHFLQTAPSWQKDIEAWHEMSKYLLYFDFKDSKP